MYKKVKIIGLQRSGTNWISQLVKLNFNIEVYANPVEPFFKHALPYEHKLILKTGEKTIQTAIPAQYIEQHPDELFILVYKSPSIWIDSISRKKVDLQQKRPRLFDRRNQLSVQKARVFWIKYMYRWMDLPFPNLKIISYMEVLANFEAFLTDLNITREIPAKVNAWVNTDKVEHSSLFTNAHRNRYLNFNAKKSCTQ